MENKQLKDLVKARESLLEFLKYARFVEDQLDIVINSYAPDSVKQELNPIRQQFPPDLVDWLTFDETPSAYIVKGKNFDKMRWGDTNSIVKDLGGKWITDGVNSRFEIPKLTAHQEPAHNNQVVFQN